jgi:16S rRNA (cytosine967-C5)-methyltransferase
LRRAAWKILRSGSATPLRLVARLAERRGLPDRDRGLLRRIVACELRRRATLRALVAGLGGAQLSPEAATFAHVGLVQLFFLDGIPSHAAVAETVRACGRTLGKGPTRRVRDLLLRAVRERREGASGDPRRDLPLAAWHFERALFHDPTEHPYLWAEDALSIPAPLVKRWAKRHGLERATELARTFLVEPELSLRVVRDASDTIFSELAAAGVPVRRTSHSRIFLVDRGGKSAVLRSAAFAEGRVTVQGESALRAAELVEPRDGERLLDLCAAPGGKSAVLAESGAAVLLGDKSTGRLALARETLTRLVPDARVLFVAGDAGSAFARESFDGVLVDAPCSNTGVLGARPEARWRFGPASRATLGLLQERLLAAGAELVRAGGRLVWSTCSLEPEENGQRVRAFLAAHEDWQLEAEEAALPGPPGTTGPIDGGYAARLRRRR